MNGNRYWEMNLVAANIAKPNTGQEMKSLVEFAISAKIHPLLVAAARL